MLTIPSSRTRDTAVLIALLACFLTIFYIVEEAALSGNIESTHALLSGMSVQEGQLRLDNQAVEIQLNTIQQSRILPLANLRIDNLTRQTNSLTRRWQSANTSFYADFHNLHANISDSVASLVEEWKLSDSLNNGNVSEVTAYWRGLRHQVQAINTTVTRDLSSLKTELIILQNAIKNIQEIMENKE